MRTRTALLAVTALAAMPALALASTITGPYVDLGAGYNLTQSQTYKDVNKHNVVNTGGAIKGRIHQSDGYTGFLSAGWGFGNGLRVELEGIYTHSYNTSMTGHTAGGEHHKVDARGANQGYGALVNILYDIDLAQFGIDVPVTPFVGIGAGYMWEKYNVHGGAGKYLDGPVYRKSNYMRSTNGGFAAQAIIGAAYDIPGVPGLALTTQYRFLAQTGSQSGVNNGTLHDSSPNHNRVHSGTRYQHQFILGLRYAFNNAPPPPPAPAHVVVPPQRTAARTYLVFFDWDKANLTPRAREIVAQAAQASTHVQTTRIEVNGYTDNSAAHPGPRGEKYNMGLSLRRANSVKAELVRDGVPAAAIDIHGYGEAHPLVATAPNTREPQNRRVEIILK